MDWKVAIADDEAPAREELAYLLQQVEGVKEVYLAKDGVELLKLIKEKKPDIVFLDIEMPRLSGLQTAELIAELGLSTKIVFSTAFDQYALNAFKLRAFHYILKPYDEGGLQNIFHELKELRQGAPEKTVNPQSASTVKLAIEISGSVIYLSPKNIIYINKEGKRVLVHTKARSYEAGYTLQELEEKLNSFFFFRCHKSYLVNLDYVIEMKSWVNGAYNLTMRDSAGSFVPVSRNYVKELRMRLEL